MRQRRKLFVSLMAALAAAPLLVLGPALPAEATEAAELAWSHQVTQLEPTSLISQLDGNVTAAQCSEGPSSSTLAAKEYHYSGSTVWTGRQIANNANPRPNICPSNGESVVDKTGDLYTIAQAPPLYRTQLAAYEGSTQKWIISTLPHSCQILSKLTVGTNGNIYALLSRCGPWAQESYLFGLTPEVQAGSNLPATVLDVPVGANPVKQGLAAYAGGLVVQYTDGIQYYTYSGNTSGPQTVNNLGYTWQLSATVDGRVFLPIREANTAACPAPNSATAESIVAFGPNGLQWTYSSLPACTDVYELRSRYDDGVVAHVVVNDGIVNEQRFIAISQSGQSRWTVPYITPGGVFHPGWATTLNGDIALQGQYRQDNHYGVKFMLLSGLTGEALSVADFYSATDGYYPVNQSTDITIAKDRAYLSLSKCPGGWPCGAEPTLYALNVPGLEMDYPRGAILGQDEPWRDYVALGDSFSSGQGVTPYEAGTDTAGPPENRCRRSQTAYARLLDDLPSSHLNLTAFVACGGAETAHVLNGRFGEVPQANSVSTGTDVVTITIGGNDIGFEGFGSDCFWGACNGASHDEVANRIEDELPSKLDTLYQGSQGVKSRIGPQTRVLVIGYPLFIPDPNINTLPNCGYLTQEEKIAVRDVITKLNEAISAAVSRAGNQFEYVNPNTSTSPFKGHELCLDSSYFNGVVLPPNESFSFHPNVLGQDAYRRLIQIHVG